MAKKTLQADVLAPPQLGRLLDLARTDPLSCALGMSGAKDEALLLVDRKVKPKKLAEQIKSSYGDRIDAKTVRFGRVSVAASDPGTVQLRLNKAVVGGTPVLLVKIVKKSGYEGVSFEEDATIGDEEDATGDGAPEAVSPAPQEAATPAAPARGARPEPLPPGLLQGLAMRVKRAVTAAPAQAKPIADAWRALQAAAENGGDALGRAAALRELLDRGATVGAAAPDPAAIPPAPPAPPPDPVAKVVARADEIWQDSTVLLRRNLDGLKKTLVDAYGDLPQVQSAIRDRLDAMDDAFGWMDDRLTRKLAELRSAPPADRAALAREGAAIADQYVQAVKGSALLRDLDGNPFKVKTEFVDTVVKRSLPAVSRLMAAVR